MPKSLAQLEIDRQFAWKLAHIAQLRAARWQTAERVEEFMRLERRCYKLTRKIGSEAAKHHRAWRLNRPAASGSPSAPRR
jgi:hypothetical protein